MTLITIGSSARAWIHFFSQTFETWGAWGEVRGCERMAGDGFQFGSRGQTGPSSRYLQ